MPEKVWSVVFKFVVSFLVAALVGCLAGPALAAKKVAFVVGINIYDNLGKDKQLQRAVNDARAVGSAFDALGFEVTLIRTACSLRSMPNGRSFSKRSRLAIPQPSTSPAMGSRSKRLNFLFPRDIPYVSYGRQGQLKRQSLSVPDFLLDLRKRRPQVTLVILDACRDHPLVPPEFKSAGPAGGLARMDAPEGTFIMYAAGAGETALDRLPQGDTDRVNSVYTRKLLPLLKKPGLTLPELARQVRSDVNLIAATVPHIQRPAYYDGLIGKFCLAGCSDEVEQAWSAIKDTTNTAVLEAFIARYKDWSFADLARARVLEIKEKLPIPPLRCDSIEALVGNEPRCLRPTDSFKDCDECPEMVVVPAGAFMMGSNEDDSEKPMHKVAISEPFAVGKFEVTFAEWKSCVVAGGCDRKPSDRGWGEGTRPVIDVSWLDVKAYVSWLAKKTGRGYRLLSEAEWEYAARGVTSASTVQTVYSWGNDIGKNRANCEVCGSQWDSKQTAVVGSFQPNAFGLHDMHGNVLEWVEDCWHTSYAQAPADGSSWTASCSGTARVLRGGSWFSGAGTLRSAVRARHQPRLRYNYVGFRLARTLNP